jgi:rare lipoprotein A
MKARRSVTIVLLLLGLAPACAQPHKVQPKAADEGAFYVETGGASWYGRWHNGMTAADGSSFDPDDFTAAHRSLKFGTIVQVINLRNHRMVKVRITDRGPHAAGRIIDVSAAAARELGMQHRGLARVRVRAYGYDQFPD